MADNSLQELDARYQNLCVRGGTLEDWSLLGVDYFQAGYGELAEACWKKAGVLMSAQEV